MTTQFKTEKGSFLLVKVPEDARNVHVWGYRLMAYELKEKFTDIVLPEANWQIVGNVWELTEEQAVQIVDVDDPISYWEHERDIFYLNYDKTSDIGSFFCKPLKSWYSLLKSLQIYKENPFRQPNREDFVYHAGVNNDHIWDDMVKQWQAAEERTGSWILLKEI